MLLDGKIGICLFQLTFDGSQSLKALLATGIVRWQLRKTSMTPYRIPVDHGVRGLDVLDVVCRTRFLL